MLENKKEEKVLSILNQLKRYLKVDRIAQLSQIPIAQVLTILNKFEKLRYLMSSSAKKCKHPAKLIKEYLQTGKHPDLYENVEKEYKISQKGLSLYRNLGKRSL